MTIEEQNKMIAEFLKVDYDSLIFSEWNDLYNGGMRNPDIMNDSANYRCYHNSWDYIMPVVEKLETMPIQLPEKFISKRIPHVRVGYFVLDTMYDDREEYKGWVSLSTLGEKILKGSQDIVRHPTKLACVYSNVVDAIVLYNEHINSK